MQCGSAADQFFGTLVQVFSAAGQAVSNFLQQCGSTFIQRCGTAVQLFDGSRVGTVAGIGSENLRRTVVVAVGIGCQERRHHDYRHNHRNRHCHTADHLAEPPESGQQRTVTGLPILMVNTNKNELAETQIEFLKSLEDCTFTIIGGDKAVSQKLEADMEAIVGNVDRIYGDSREATSVLVAETYFEDPELVLVAYSRNFPDGLCGGPLAYALGAPLLLTNAGQEAVAAEYVAENGITKGLILGGTAVISEATVDAVFGLAK